MRKANERTPRKPLPANFRPADSVPRRVTSKDSWVTLAAELEIDPWELVHYNFETHVPEEVNWYLRRNVGCREGDGKNYRFSDGLRPGVVYLPLPSARLIGTYEVRGFHPLAPPGAATAWAATGAMLMAWKLKSRLTVQEAIAMAGDTWARILAANRALEWHETALFASACKLKVRQPQSRSVWGWRSLLRTCGPVALVHLNPFAAWVVRGVIGERPAWVDFVDAQTGVRSSCGFDQMEARLVPAGPGSQVQLWHA